MTTHVKHMPDVSNMSVNQMIASPNVNFKQMSELVGSAIQRISNAKEKNKMIGKYEDSSILMHSRDFGTMAWLYVQYADANMRLPLESDKSR